MIVSYAPRGLAKGLAKEYNGTNMPCIEVPYGFAGGNLQLSFIACLPI